MVLTLTKCFVNNRNTMTHYLACTAIGILLLQTLPSHSQTADAQPQFEVASVKLNANCGNFRGGRVPFSPGRLAMECTTLQNLIQSAYGAFATGTLNQEMLQISGGPGWVESDRYDLAAKAEGAARVEQMMGPMLRALLEDRFKLKIHRETKETPVYALTVAKSGLKIQPVKEGGCVPIDLNHLPQPPEPGRPRPNYCGNVSIRMSPQGVTMETHGSTMTEFAQRLSGLLDRKVVDKSGIAGQFDFHLEFAPDESTRGFGGRGAGDAGGATPPAAPEGPSVFDALQQQFGLRLTPDKAPVDSLVIDHVEKPSEN
jgi:uncharacterized protein (TIGR03435 family)